jgi:hypothetical protein
MHSLFRASLVLLTVALVACSGGNSSPSSDAGTGGALGSGGATGTGGATPGNGTGGAPGTGGAGGQGGGGSGGRDAATTETAEDRPSTPEVADTASDTVSDAIDGGGDVRPKNCMDVGSECPGNQVCKPLQGGGWSCFPPGIEP